MSHLDANVKGAELELTDEDVRALDAAGRATWGQVSSAAAQPSPMPA